MDPLQTNIMTSLGFDKLPETEQADLYNRIGAVIFQGVVIRALEEMPEEEQDALDKFLGEHPEDPSALLGYLREHAANFDDLVESEVARFKASAMEIMEKESTA